MQFILNQDGELIITDEAEEAFDLDETDEWDFERTKVCESRFWERGNAKSQNQSGRQDLNLRPFGPQNFPANLYKNSKTTWIHAL